MSAGKQHARKVVRLGRTGIETGPHGFGALPIQRVPRAEAVALVRRACEGGIGFFDTARGYTDSEEKLGMALQGLRDGVFIATKTVATTPEAFRANLETSLRTLRTGWIDLYQFHNPAFCPKPGDGTGLYEEMLAAKERGLVRHIGITNHRMGIALEAVRSGLYETLQFPFSYLSDERDLALVEACAGADMGFIAMKAMSGGLIRNSGAASAFMAQFGHVLPIWGIQRMEELEEFLACTPDETPLSEFATVIERDRVELRGGFCRGCGYCKPCPSGIEIDICARMSLMIRRMPPEGFLTGKARERMARIGLCTHCGACRAKCPYGLDPPALLERNYADYLEILAGKPL